MRLFRRFFCGSGEAADQGLYFFVGRRFRGGGRGAGYEGFGAVAEGGEALIAGAEAALGGFAEAAELGAAHRLIFVIGGRSREARFQDDAVGGAGGEAQAAAYAFVVEDRVGEVSGADDGVHGAGGEAACAAYAQGFVDSRDLRVHVRVSLQGFYCRSPFSAEGRMRGE